MVSTSIQLWGAATTRLGPAETEGGQQHDPLVHGLPRFTQQVLAGDTDVELAGQQTGGDIAGRGEADLDFGEAVEGRRIATHAASHAQGQTRVGQPGFDLLLQPALRGQGDDERFAGHDAPTQARPGRTMQPTAPVTSVSPSLAARPS